MRSIAKHAIDLRGRRSIDARRATIGPAEC